MKKATAVSMCLPFQILLVLTGLIVQSCDLFKGLSYGKGELRISFAEGQEILTRAGLEIPDTSDFIITVRNAAGTVVYDDFYGALPEVLSLDTGSYMVKIISEEFGKPAFSKPQFGDEQCVVISPGETINLKLVCRQLNSGIRLHIDKGFLTSYPDGALILKSSFGRLLYSYSERRIAYFTPGNISLILADKGDDEILMTRTLEAQEILELKITLSEDTNSESESQEGFSIAVDTTRVWLSESYVIGGSGGTSESMLTVSEAANMAGEEDVWVYGYIVGGDLTSSTASFSKPFSSRTNILIGPRSSTDKRQSCLSVQLPAGEMRDELNLVDNPGLLGRKICLKGDIVDAYYSLPGIKNITEYEML